MKKYLVGLYDRYLPALTTFLGTVLLAVGFLPGHEWLAFIGGLIAGIGALWSSHRQVKADAEIRNRDQKIIDLSEQVQSYLTGGNSFHLLRRGRKFTPHRRPRRR